MDDLNYAPLIRDRSIFMGIRDRELNSRIDLNNWWSCISKSLETQGVIQDYSVKCIGIGIDAYVVTPSWLACCWLRGI